MKKIVKGDEGQQSFLVDVPDLEKVFEGSKEVEINKSEPMEVVKNHEKEIVKTFSIKVYGNSSEFCSSACQYYNEPNKWCYFFFKEKLEQDKKGRVLRCKSCLNDGRFGK